MKRYIKALGAVLLAVSVPLSGFAAEGGQLAAFASDEDGFVADFEAVVLVGREPLKFDSGSVVSNCVEYLAALKDGRVLKEEENLIVYGSYFMCNFYGVVGHGEKYNIVLTNHESKTPAPTSPMELPAPDEDPRLGVIAEKFNNAAVASGTKGFADITEMQRTVMLSVARQYGPNLDVVTPRLWKAAVAGDWDKVAQLLEDFGDDYASRRYIEADSLRK